VPVEGGIRYGYWMPVFGGWLRNVEDEHMEASWQYVSKLARRSEQIGYDLSLIAELNLNDIRVPMRRALMHGRRRPRSRPSPTAWN
jgi:dimethylsulfone monooxygenase